MGFGYFHSDMYGSCDMQSYIKMKMKILSVWHILKEHIFLNVHPSSYCVLRFILVIALFDYMHYLSI